MDKLPYDILEIISNKLSFKDFISLTKVNKTLNELKHNTSKYVEYCIQNYSKNKFMDCPSDFASANGLDKVLEWFHYNNHIIGYNSYKWASLNGYINIIKFLQSNSYPFDERLYRQYNNKPSIKSPIYHNPFHIACANKHYNVVEFLYNNYGHCLSRSDIVLGLKELCKYGHIDSIKLLYSDKFDKEDIVEMIEILCYNNHLQLIKFICNNSELVKKDIYYVINIAGQCGHLNIIKWFHKKISNELDEAIYYACANNQLETVKWLFHNTTECDIEKLQNISLLYSNDIYEWLKKKQGNQYNDNYSINLPIKKIMLFGGLFLCSVVLFKIKDKMEFGTDLCSAIALLIVYIVIIYIYVKVVNNCNSNVYSKYLKYVKYAPHNIIQ